MYDCTTIVLPIEVSIKRLASGKVIANSQYKLHRRRSIKRSGLASALTNFSFVLFCDWLLNLRCIQLP